MEYSECICELQDCALREPNELPSSPILNTFNRLTTDQYPLGSLDMIMEDEFCHDLLLPMDAEWLIFGMT